MKRLNQNNPAHPRGARAFTLVEILIVVVILGILAAIVIPKFSNASHQARENSLKDELRYMRVQIQVFKAQHRDINAGITADFIEQMTKFTDEYGNVSNNKTSLYKFGPYLTKMPSNSINSLATIQIVTSGNLADEADGSHGWIYNPNTGEIIADIAGVDSNGTPYAQY